MSEQPWLRTGIGDSDADSITLMGRDLPNELMGRFFRFRLAGRRCLRFCGRLSVQRFG